jgi:hypothetical protein
LRRGREWFKTPDWPPLVLWWHTDPGYPSWAEGVRRHELLHDCGPSPMAFSFKVPFDENGVATRLDKSRIQKLRQSYASG